jgi:hypothetical protein
MKRRNGNTTGLERRGRERSIDLARLYVKKIRHTGKQLYARAYLAFALNGGAEPDAERFGISYMAAQAVRRNILELLPAGTLTPEAKPTPEPNPTPEASADHLQERGPSAEPDADHAETNARTQAGEPQHWIETEAGMQGVLIHTQRTLKRQGAKTSNIPASKQLEGTMFERESEANQMKLF